MMIKNLTTNRWYREEMAQWRAKLPTDILKKLDKVTHWDTSRISQSLMGSLFSTIKAHTIDEIIQAITNDEVMEVAGRKAGSLPPQGPYRTMLVQVLRAVKILGFEDYWHKDIEPIVQQLRIWQSISSLPKAGELNFSSAVMPVLLLGLMARR
ncbi:hypothetical protein H8E77_07555 [bacterium]|nr:hypothetical protein [bacterium]